MSSTKVQPNSNLPARLVLSLIHLLYSFVQQFLQLCGWIRWKLSIYQRKLFLNERRNSTAPVIDGSRSSATQLRWESDEIEADVRALDKIPVHLVVMLGPEDADYKQLAKFIFWSLAAGIGHVSFYDHQGTLKHNHHKMLNYVSQQPRGESEQIVWTPQLKTASGLLPPRNGYRRRVVVSFFSPDDGKRQLATIAKTISTQLRTGSGPTTTPSDITIELVNQRLQAQTHHIPDPELAVYFGSICSTYGMLPWQIRLTEFQPLEAPGLGDVKVGHFLSCLYRFAKCEQRFGK